ncbi:helix-turn-helix transcriptional regulator ['Paenibacillus yunnanensis' Narsing Rao et al. 2020]|uniref:helix-turn-helix transcriptional regulator n=1 Tax=Paenibacillus tengchongensis TaxID=2608684 RepID=UPI001651C30E|nr:helix-turn-helix transcriptional regulator [Paenibacillus tengchongensis]
MRLSTTLMGLHPAFLINPSGFVSALRIERTCRLLGETRLSLDRVAEQCGYENGFYLS